MLGVGTKLKVINCEKRKVGAILRFSQVLCWVRVLIVAARGKTCHSHAQCLKDECCVTKSSMVGGCRSKPCEGCACLPELVKASLGDMFLMSCPCSDGLSCVPEDIVENKEEQTVKYLNSTCKTHEELLNLYKRLLESRKLHPRLLSSIFRLD